MRILAVDPGNVESAFALIDSDTRRPVDFGKLTNESLRVWLLEWVPAEPHRVAIEMVASYGMRVGREVFETCVWIGRLVELCDGFDPELIYRLDVKMHHCHDSRAKDSNITQALIDRFAHNAPNRGKGTKAAPGWFHGFRADVWQAYALAVYVADLMENTLANPLPNSVPGGMMGT